MRSSLHSALHRKPHHSFARQRRHDCCKVVSGAFHTATPINFGMALQRCFCSQALALGPEARRNVTRTSYSDHASTGKNGVRLVKESSLNRCVAQTENGERGRLRKEVKTREPSITLTSYSFLLNTEILLASPEQSYLYRCRVRTPLHEHCA